MCLFLQRFRALITSTIILLNIDSCLAFPLILTLCSIVCFTKFFHNFNLKSF